MKNTVVLGIRESGILSFLLFLPISSARIPDSSRFTSPPSSPPLQRPPQKGSFLHLPGLPSQPPTPGLRHSPPPLGTQRTCALIPYLYVWGLAAVQEVGEQAGLRDRAWDLNGPYICSKWRWNQPTSFTGVTEIWFFHLSVLCGLWQPPPHWPLRPQLFFSLSPGLFLHFFLGPHSLSGSSFGSVWSSPLLSLQPSCCLSMAPAHSAVAYCTCLPSPLPPCSVFPRLWGSPSPCAFVLGHFLCSFPAQSLSLCHSQSFWLLSSLCLCLHLCLSSPLSASLYLCFCGHSAASETKRVWCRRGREPGQASLPAHESSVALSEPARGRSAQQNVLGLRPGAKEIHLSFLMETAPSQEAPASPSPAGELCEHLRESSLPGRGFHAGAAFQGKHRPWQIMCRERVGPTHHKLPAWPSPAGPRGSRAEVLLLGQAGSAPPEREAWVQVELEDTQQPG